MNSEITTLTFQDLQALLAKSQCFCHIINPNKTRIILWKEIKDGKEIYHLRIGLQKFTSYELTDRYANPYWKFNDDGKNDGFKGNGVEKVLTDNIAENVAKFRRREPKKEYGETNNSEPVVNSDQSN